MCKNTNIEYLKTLKQLKIGADKENKIYYNKLFDFPAWMKIAALYTNKC